MLKHINLPESVKNIGAGAFKNCSALRKITLPSSVKTIEKDAFRNVCPECEIVYNEMQFNLVDQLKKEYDKTFSYQFEPYKLPLFC
jgi:hypothetical protein